MSPRGGGGGGRQPIPGRQYILTEDGTLDDLGIIAYGQTGKGPLIWGANPHLHPTVRIPKGTAVIIPGEVPPAALTGRELDDLTCIIGTRTVPLESARVVVAMDTACDGWSAQIAWTPGADPQLDHVTRPFGYERASVYIGNRMVVNGRLYGTGPEMADKGTVMNLEGFSFTADLVDSSVVAPYELSNVTIKYLGDRYAERIGIKCYLSDELKDDADFNAPFPRVSATAGEKIFPFLARLVAQRGGLVTNTAGGDLYILRAKDEGKAVGTLQEGQGFVTGWKAHYDGRQRYHLYTVISAGVKGRGAAPARWNSLNTSASTGRQLSSTITEVDNAVPISRFITYHADDVTPGNVVNAARWKKNKHFADALTIPFPVSGWYAPDGSLWWPNTLVTVVSPTLRVSKGYTFLVRSVQFGLHKNRRDAVLNLVPPAAFTGKDLGDIWT